jgi:hypothetical protein
MFLMLIVTTFELRNVNLLCCTFIRRRNTCGCGVLLTRAAIHLSPCDANCWGFRSVILCYIIFKLDFSGKNPCTTKTWRALVVYLSSTVGQMTSSTSRNSKIRVLPSIYYNIQGRFCGKWRVAILHKIRFFLHPHIQKIL